MGAKGPTKWLPPKLCVETYRGQPVKGLVSATNLCLIWIVLDLGCPFEVGWVWYLGVEWAY